MRAGTALEKWWLQPPGIFAEIFRNVDLTARNANVSILY
jgi:hypothetical protein